MLLDHSWWPKVKCWPVTPLRSSEVTEVTNRFLQITWDCEELETWKWSHYACLVNTLRLICNLGHAVTLTWGQTLTLTFQGHSIHVSMHLDEANTMVSKSLLYHFKHRSYHWKTVLLKNAVFDLSWPLTLNPRTAGGLSHLHTAGGAHMCPPPPANSKTTQRIDKRKKALDRS